MTIYRGFDRLLSFVSVHHAIRAEKILLAAGIAVVALPVPREIDISCGQCLLFEADNQQRVFITVQDHKLQWSKLFMCNLDDRVYEELASW